jgi:aspartate aminotransferase
VVVNAVSYTAAFTQHAAVAALTGPWEPVEAMVREFKTRRDVIVDGLNRIEGLSCQEPAGAFYVFPNASAYGHSMRDLVGYLLEEAGVAALWGSAFGGSGEGYLRFSYANSVENIRAALEAMEAALPGYRGG